MSLSNYVQRTILHFLEDPSYVKAGQPSDENLDPAEKDDNRNGRGIAGLKVDEEELANDQQQGQQQPRDGDEAADHHRYF